MSKLRVCAVSYLNTVPLVWGMLHGQQRDCFELDFRLPADCADLLKASAADIGIVPSIEIARQSLDVIPGAGIACRGPVRSILLVTKVPPEQIRTLATDSSSRTSVMLARIVLARRYAAEPHCVALPPDLRNMLDQADAALIIGDPALRIDPAKLPFTALDLGQEWCDMTGLPMVFAAWGCREEVMLPGLAEVFVESCRFGLAHMDDIVQQEAAARNFEPALVRDYLTRNLVSELGEKEYEGMRLFLRYANDFDMLVSTAR